MNKGPDRVGAFVMQTPFPTRQRQPRIYRVGSCESGPGRLWFGSRRDRGIQGSRWRFAARQRPVAFVGHDLDELLAVHVRADLGQHLVRRIQCAELVIRGSFRDAALGSGRGLGGCGRRWRELGSGFDWRLRLGLRLGFPFGLALAGFGGPFARTRRPACLRRRCGTTNLDLLFGRQSDPLRLTVRCHQGYFQLAGIEPFLDLLGGLYRQRLVEAVEVDDGAQRQVLHGRQFTHGLAPWLLAPFANRTLRLPRPHHVAVEQAALACTGW